MITPTQVITITTRAAEAHAATSPWPQAVHYTVRSLIDRLAEAHHLPAPKLPRLDVPAAEAILDELGPLTGWQVLDLGEIHQQLLTLDTTRAADGTVTAHKAATSARDAQGAWYTPPEIAQAMCRLSLGPQLDRLAQDPDPGELLQILAIDPACGAGVFLVEAARYIAARLAARVSGHDPAPAAHLRAALPVVMRECIFGIDIDPVAVDLAKTAAWLEIGGCAPFTFMDRNIIVGNPLDLDLPPAYAERCGDPPTAEERRRTYAAAVRP
jgi:hypothetical protein